MSLQSLALSTALFQSTPPVKAATATRFWIDAKPTISIHAAREGGDGEPAAISRRRHDFNPRRP